ncbi:MAG: tetratricopeptide repeat protein, partial [Thermoplasmata archaeon]
MIDDDNYLVENVSDLKDISIDTYTSYFYNVYHNLNDVEKRLITAASVIGIKFNINELSYLEPLDKIKIVEILDKLVKSNIINALDNENFEFQQVEYQEILYKKEILNLRRRFLHKKLAEYYEKSCTCPDKIGLNYYLGLENGKAEFYLREAVDLMVLKNDYRSALNYMEKIMSISKNKNVDDFILIGDCYFKLGNFKKAINYYDMSMEMVNKDDKNLVSKILIKKADVYSNQGNYKESKNILEEVSKIADPNNISLMFHINSIIVKSIT